MKLVKVRSGWYEADDGRHSLLLDRSGQWCLVATGPEGPEVIERFKTRRDAASALASRVMMSRTEE